MGIEPNILAFPGRKTIMTKARLEKELARVREELRPYYEDDDEALDADIATAKSKDIGAVGLMSAIAWCHGQVATYQLLSNSEDSEDTLRA